MSDSIRIAFIGAGGITRRHAAAVLAHPERFTVAGVADPSREHALALAAQFEGDVPVFESHEALFEARADEIDGVVITTPHWLHYPMAAAALRHDIPALVEKPVTCSLDELRKLKALEADSSAFVMAGQMQRFGNVGRWLRDWAGDPERCGDLLSFQIECWQNLEGYLARKPDPWILDGKKAGGGICISVAIHQLDLVRFVSGADFVEVGATGRFDPPMYNGAESACMAWLRMSNGTIGTLNTSYTMMRCGYSQGTLFSGSRGTVFPTIEEWGNVNAELYVADHLEPLSMFSEMFKGFEKVGDQPSFTEMPEVKDHFIAQFLEFGASIREKRRPCENTLAGNFNTVAVVEALGESMRTGRPQEVAKE